MNLSYNTETDIKGTIRLHQPLRGLGIVCDVDGKRWDIHGIIRDYVQACPETELHPYYTDTSGFTNHGIVSQKWEPYRIEIVEKETVK